MNLAEKHGLRCPKCKEWNTYLTEEYQFYCLGCGMRFEWFNNAKKLYTRNVASSGHRWTEKPDPIEKLWGNRKCHL